MFEINYMTLYATWNALRVVVLFVIWTDYP